MSTHQTVLVLADSDHRDRHYEQQLQQNGCCAYKIITGKYTSPVHSLSQSQQIDGIVLERHLPQSNSIQILRQLKEQMGDRCPPIVVIDEDDADLAVRAFKNGAADYLVRDRMTPDDLRLALRSAIENAELQQKLQRSQEQFQTSVENMLDCFGIFSAMRDDSGQIIDFRIDYLNEAACQSNRMAKEAQIGRRLCEVLPGHRESGLFDEYCRLVETGEPLTKESLIYNDIYGDCRLVRAFDIQAARLNDGFVASWRDITSRKQLEVDLKISQQCYRELAEAMPQIVWTADATGAVNYWNQRWYEYTGLSETESMGIDGVSVVHPDECDRTLTLWSEAIIQEKPFEMEYRIRHWGGDYHWFICRAVPTRDEQNQITGWIGTITNIDDLKCNEVRVQQSEEHFRHMANNLPVMAWVTDPTGYCTYLNQGWYDFTGQTEATGLGFGWLDAVHPDDSELSKAVFLNALCRQEAFRLEYRLRRKDGEYCWAIDAASPWFGENGEFKGYIGSVIDISDRKQAEEALRLSEERYRTLFETMNEGFCVIEMVFDDHNRPLDYRFLEINPRFEQQTGLRQAVGKTARELLPDLEPHWFELYGSVALTGEPIRFENGSDVMNRWFEVSAFRIGEPESRKVAILFKEISARKQAERKLQESETRFRTLADNISQFAWIADENGSIFWYNQRWFDYTGTTLEEVQGWGWQKVHHPDHRERVVEKLRQCFQTGEIWEDTFPLRGRNGDYRWFLSRAIPVRNEQGQVLRWFGTNTDITDRQEAGEALRQSEERYRCLAELIPQLVWTANGEGALLDVNQRWIEFTGLTLEEVRTAGWEQVVYPEDVPVLTHHWTQAVQQGTPYQAEGRMRQADGSYRWYLHQAIPQRNEQGEIIKWFGTATDIEVQKQLELARDRLLQQEQQAREVAERANRIKDEFLAVLSHELRSPLNPILGWSKLLQTRKLDEAKTAIALATIERNARVQAQLIDDLLDVAKILRGKLTLNKASVNLTSVVEASIETVKTSALAKAISLHPVLPNIGQVLGDAARLQQVVWNLLSNAIKFTPNGGRVDIQLNRLGNQAEITVRDTGRGINPDFLPHIFESFRQEDASITRKYGGLGLGLAIVRQLVEAHGGTITAESLGEGFGAAFIVQLPLLDITPNVWPIEELPEEDLNLTGIRVLAVDDDPDARELLTVLLSQYGADVLSVSSAVEVLDNLASFQPDLLVSDIGMPGIDGYTLIQQIRTLPPEAGGQIPAIALTAYAREEDFQRAIASGFQRHVAKPLEPEQLVRAVLALMPFQVS